MQTHRKPLVTITVIVSIFLALCLFGYLANKYFGIFRQIIDVGNPLAPKTSPGNANISKSASGSLSIPSQTITSPVTRFAIDIGPKQIESVTARLKFKPGPREIKLGIRANAKEPYLYEPLYHQLLQDVSWDPIEQFGETLYQKTRNYDSIGALISNPPDYHDIASYYVDGQPLMQKLFSGGSGQTNANRINEQTGLRGTHTFLVWVDKVPFTFKLTKQDLNAVAGEDTYIVGVYSDDQLLDEKTIPDDGFAGTEKLKRNPQSVEFTLDSIKPGIYKIIATNKSGDSLITALQTNQSKLVIVNQVYAFSTSPVTLYTGHSPVTLTAANRDFTQTVMLDGKIPLDLKKAGEKYVFDLDTLNPGGKPADLSVLEIPKTNVVVKSSGYFALSKDQYFNPNIIDTTDLTKVSSLGDVNYLLTPVKKAQVEGDWLVSDITIDATSLKRDQTNKLYVSLEMPNLASSGGKLEIGSFEMGVGVPGIFADKSNANGAEKPTIISKITTIPKDIGAFMSDAYQKVRSFLVNSFNNIFAKNKQPVKPAVPTKTPTPKPSPAPTAEASPTPTPTAKPSPSPVDGSIKSVKIEVLNGGAPDGYAKKYADLIKNAGYINVEIGNADNASTNGALIAYPSLSEPDVKIIEDILKPEYGAIHEAVDDEKTDVTVTVGAK